MTISAPFGSWRSPLDIDLLTAGQIDLGGGALDGGRLYWTEGRADEGGRVSLWCLDGDTRTELTPGDYVRNMVHEYDGGGSWAVRDGVVVYSTHPRHTCFRLVDGQRHQLTPDTGLLRYAAFEIHPDRNLVLAVREDHTTSDLDCVNEIIALRLDSDNADGGTVLVTGADFYSCPRLSATGELAWIEWDHPHMPWDTTRLMRGRLTDELTVVDVVQVAGVDAPDHRTAPCYPAWRGEELVFLDDPDGYWNFHVAHGTEVASLHEATDPHDFTLCPWRPHQPYHLLDDGRIVCTRFVDGKADLSVLADGVTTSLGRDALAMSFSGHGRTLVGTFSYADRPTELATLDVATGAYSVLRRSVELTGLEGYLSVGTPLSWEGPEGDVHSFFYAPTNRDFVGPDGELPMLKVLSHGGPTGFTNGCLDLTKQYWTSRGWAILDVNYGGSGGYGRAYRERLQGQWGVVDVRDCAQGALAMVERGLVDGRRLAIEGGSAGGFTTLAALTSTDVFTAGCSRYGIADLAAIAHDTHKFESRYLYGLVGGTPEEAKDRYEERSPLYHLDRLSCPMIIQQGLDDRVVPPNQAHMMAEAVRAKGLPLVLQLFEGEGHGFRKQATIRATVEGSNSFFGQVYGYVPDGIAPITIENLPPTLSSPR